MELHELRDNILKYPVAAIRHNGLAQDAGSFAQSRTSEGGSSERLVVIVDKQPLQRECLARALAEYNPALNLATVGSLDGFRNMMRSQADVSAVVVVVLREPYRIRTSVPSCRTSSLKSAQRRLSSSLNSDEPADVLATLECGARGYIPTSVGARVVAEAIGLARAGGTFVPGNAVLALRTATIAATGSDRPLTGMLTNRQAAVADALRKGKPNKIIAYELNMCESTVKVHVRNLMKKLNATNRTQIAFKLSQMLD